MAALRETRPFVLEEYVMASLRHERLIEAAPQDVWNIVRRPQSITDWFPGVASCRVDGRRRVLTLATGLEVPEEILSVDEGLRRFAYRIVAPAYKFHLGTIDVLSVGAHSLCVYSTTAEPDTLALIIAGATIGALEEIKRQAESWRAVLRERGQE